jgi:outer membrane lipoprotein carrier protein
MLLLNAPQSGENVAMNIKAPRKLHRILLVVAALLLPAVAVAARAESHPGADEILDRVVEHYSVPGFSARFEQESTIKAMGITDTASGRIFVRRPGSMRWQYEMPERQVIITDGAVLWIYKPDDDQVMVGRAPAFFGDGKGAGFLADIGALRDQFLVTRADREKQGAWVLRLEPLEPTAEVAEIYLAVSRSTYDVVEVTTCNAYGDETRIRFYDIAFGEPPAASLFQFDIPENADVVQLQP